MPAQQRRVNDTSALHSLALRDGDAVRLADTLTEALMEEDLHSVGWRVHRRMLVTLARLQASQRRSGLADTHTDGDTVSDAVTDGDTDTDGVLHGT